MYTTQRQHYIIQCSYMNQWISKSSQVSCYAQCFFLLYESGDILFCSKTFLIQLCTEFAYLLLNVNCVSLFFFLVCFYLTLDGNQITFTFSLPNDVTCGISFWFDSNWKFLRLRLSELQFGSRLSNRTRNKRMVKEHILWNKEI